MFTRYTSGTQKLKEGREVQKSFRRVLFLLDLFFAIFIKWTYQKIKHQIKRLTFFSLQILQNLFLPPPKLFFPTTKKSFKNHLPHAIPKIVKKITNYPSSPLPAHSKWLKFVDHSSATYLLDVDDGFDTAVIVTNNITGLHVLSPSAKAFDNDIYQLGN